MEANSGAGEMYKLSDDPTEMDNLFDDPGYRSQRLELLDMLAERPRDQLSPALSASGIA